MPSLAIISAPANRHLGHDINSPEWTRIAFEVYNFMESNDIDKVVSRLSPGFDQLVARLAVNTGIPLHAIVPAKGFHLIWPTRTRWRAESLIRDADKTTVIADRMGSKAIADAAALLVESADILLVLDADRSKSVARAIRSAQARGIPIYYVKDLGTGLIAPVRNQT